MSREEYERFVIERTPSLVSLAVYYGVSDDVASNCVQSSLADVWRRLETGQLSAEDLGLYLMKCVRNAALKSVLQSRARRRRELAVFELAKTEDSRTPSRPLREAERRKSVREAISKLPARQRLVIKSVMYDDLTAEEIAACCGISVNTVRTHLNRAKETLKELLAEHQSA